MSLESQIAALTSAAEDLTAEVAGKMSGINAAIAAMQTSVQTYISGQQASRSLYVDAVSGDDATAVGGDQTKPWRTVGAAIQYGQSSGYRENRVCLKVGQTHTLGRDVNAAAGPVLAMVPWGDAAAQGKPVLTPGGISANAVPYRITLAFGTAFSARDIDFRPTDIDWTSANWQMRFGGLLHATGGLCSILLLNCVSSGGGALIGVGSHFHSVVASLTMAGCSFNWPTGAATASQSSLVNNDPNAVVLVGSMSTSLKNSATGTATTSGADTFAALAYASGSDQPKNVIAPSLTLSKTALGL